MSAFLFVLNVVNLGFAILFGVRYAKTERGLDLFTSLFNLFAFTVGMYVTFFAKTHS